MGEVYSERVIERLHRIVTLFSVIFMLYHATNGEWIQKALFHCVELTARIISKNLHQRVWNLVCEDCEGDRSTTTIGDEKHAEIMLNLKPILLELIDLALKANPELSDEHACLKKISQCVKVTELVEKEFEVGSCRSARRLKALFRSFGDLYRIWEMKTEIWASTEVALNKQRTSSGVFGIASKRSVTYPSTCSTWCLELLRICTREWLVVIPFRVLNEIIVFKGITMQSRMFVYNWHSWMSKCQISYPSPMNFVAIKIDR